MCVRQMCTSPRLPTGGICSHTFPFSASIDGEYAPAGCRRPHRPRRTSASSWFVSVPGRMAHCQRLQFMVVVASAVCHIGSLPVSRMVWYESLRNVTIRDSRSYFTLGSKIQLWAETFRRLWIWALVILSGSELGLQLSYFFSMFCGLINSSYVFFFFFISFFCLV